MSKLTAYNFITLNGTFSGPNGDLSWHQHGNEEAEYAAKGAQSDSILLFGRITYEMMASYWPTPQAMKDNPKVAAGMNASEKFVFSKSLKSVDWENTSIISHNIFDEVRKLKSSSGKSLTILGSGSIINQFTNHGLIDEYQIMIDPVAISGGRPIFEDLQKTLNIKLIDSKVFKSGVILAVYKPQ